MGRRSSIPDTDPRKDFLIGHYVIPVEQFKPNNWGIYDVAGNALEYIDEPGQLNPICVQRNGPQKCRTIGAIGGRIYLVLKPVNNGVNAIEIAEKIMMTDVLYWSALAENTIGFRLLRE